LRELRDGTNLLGFALDFGADDYGFGNGFGYGASSLPSLIPASSLRS